VNGFNGGNGAKGNLGAKGMCLAMLVLAEMPLRAAIIYI